jgi:hypothetical protein
MKKFIMAVAVSVALLTQSIVVVAASTKQEKKVVIQYNGQDAKLQSFILNGRVFVPLKAISNKLNYTVRWYAPDKTIDIYDDNFSAQFRLGSRFVYMYGEDSLEMDVVPMLVNNTTYIPLRYVVECLGKFIEVYTWNNDMTINITDRIPTQDTRLVGKKK